MHSQLEAAEKGAADLEGAVARMLSRLECHHSALPIQQPCSNPKQAMQSFCAAKAARLRSQQMEQQLSQEQLTVLQPSVQVALEASQLHFATKHLHTAGTLKQACLEETASKNQNPAESTSSGMHGAQTAAMSALLSSTVLRRTAEAALHEELMPQHTPCYIASLGQQDVWADSLAGTALALEHFQHYNSTATSQGCMHDMECPLVYSSQKDPLTAAPQCTATAMESGSMQSLASCQHQGQMLHQGRVLFDMDAIVHCLRCTLSGEDANVRAAAEAHLQQASLLPHFGPVLAGVVSAQSEVPDPALRQLAAVVLKKYVNEHWDASSAQYQPPVCSKEDKEKVRNLLPNCLADGNSKVRTAAAMAIAAIAKFDFPHDWPGLLEWLVASVAEQRDRNLVLGVLRCLSMIAEDIDEQQLPQLVPVLLPSLLGIMTNDQYELPVKRHVLSIVHNILGQLAIMQGTFQRQVRDLMAPLLDPWIPVLAKVLEAPLTQDSSNWRLKLEVLTIMVGLVNYFGKLLGDRINVLLAPCWAMFAGSGQQLYQELVVSSTADDDAATGQEDEDGDGVGLEAVTSQMFEVLLSLVSSPRFCKLLKPVMADLARNTVLYMQMTREQAEAWSDNPNTYVADEEDAISTARVSGELLLDELCKSQGLPAVTLVLDAVDQVLQLADTSRQSGSTDWWKLREAGLLAAGCLAEPFKESADELRYSGKAAAGKQAAAVQQGQARLQALLEMLPQRDLQGPNSNPFLAGRALWAAAKLTEYMTPQQLDVYLTAACAGIRSNLPAPVRIGACRALVRLLPRVVKLNKSQGGAAADASSKLAPVLPGLYEGLILLLGESSEETQHLVLETLRVVVQQDKRCVVQQYLGQVAGPVLRVWESSVADPLIGEDAQSVLAALAAHPQCLLPLVNEMLPALVRVVSAPTQKGTQQQPMLLEGSLAMLRMLVRQPASLSSTNGRTSSSYTYGSQGLTSTADLAQSDPVVAQHLAVVQQVYLAVAPALLTLIDSSDDSSVQEEAQMLLCQLIRSGGPALLSWGGAAPASSVARLMHTLFRLLSGEVGETESVLAGYLATDLMTACPPDLMQPHVRQLLELVCARLVTVNYSALVSGLLLVLSKLTHQHRNQLIDALDTIHITLPSGQVVNALEAVLPVWAERAVDVTGHYHNALVTTALGALLESGHPRLQQLQVRGKRVDTCEGVRTRAQAAAAAAAGAGPTYTQVPATLKLVAALSQVLLHAQEAEDGLGGYEEEEEEGDDEAGEYEEEGDEAGPGGAAGLGVQGTSFTPAQASLLRSVSSPGGDDDNNKPWLSAMALGDGLGGGLGDGGPLSPSSALRGDDAAGVAEDAAPPGDPLARLDLGKWVGELFQRIALQENGAALLQAAAVGAMSKGQAEAVQTLLRGSRLRL